MLEQLLTNGMTPLGRVMDNHGPAIVKWLAILGIAYTLAALVIFFVSGGNASPVVAAPVETAPAAPTQPLVNIDAIVERHLFGQVLVERVEEEKVVETKLNLELQSVFVADVAENSAAIIAEKGRPGVLYTIGKQVANRATLTEVNRDHVLLRRAGALEKLAFDEVKVQVVNPGSQPQAAASSPASTRTPAASQAGAAADPNSTIREIASRVQEDPTGTLKSLGVAPVADGSSSGYRLGSAASSPLLRQTGLQPGDVILSVNGRPVGDISQDQLEIDNVIAQGAARIEVQRGSRRFFVTASLK